MLEEKDVLKEGDGNQPAGDEQPEKTVSEDDNSGEQPPIKDEETLEELRARLAQEQLAREKAERDRDNYKQGMLNAKAKRTVLSPDLVEEKKPDVAPPVTFDDDLDAVAVRKLIAEETRKAYQEQTKETILKNEEIAVRKFIQQNPELEDDLLRQAVVDEYAPKHGKTVEGIMMDLERAYKFYKLDNNISIKSPEEIRATEEKRKTEAKLAGMPTGSGKSDTKPSGFSDFDNQVMKEYGIKPETYKQFKEKALRGEMGLPDEVLEKLSKS